MPKSDRLKRRPPFREPLPRILLVCEGQKTERGYFNHLRRTERIPIELIIESGGTPKHLVEKAVELKKAAKRDPYDEVWCVFDIDEHPYIDDAKQQARDNKIGIAPSNPCFELWVLLHFQDQRAHIDGHSAQHLCKRYLPGYVKELPCDKLLPLRDDAISRAVALASWQESRNNAGANPSTQVHLVVQRIRSFKN